MIPGIRTKGYYFDPEKKEENKIVLLFCGNAIHVEMYSSLWKETDINFLVLCASLNQESVIKVASKYNEGNVRFTNDMNWVMLNADLLGLVITSFGLPLKQHELSFPLIHQMIQLNIPVLGIQHGMFQWGINFADEAKFFTSTSLVNTVIGAGAIYPLRFFADEMILWYGENGIGYPRMTKTNLSNYKTLCQCNFTLLVTNLNHHIYSPEELHLFYTSVSTLINNYPDNQFFWRPHPAEIGCRKSVFDMFYQNVFSHAKNMRILDSQVNKCNFHPMDDEPTEHLIARAKNIISMPSTVLLDAEMYQKPTLLFETYSNKDMIKAFKKVTVFNSKETLLSTFEEVLKKPESAVMESGMLEPFSAIEFEKIVKRNLNLTEVKKENVLLAYANAKMFAHSISV